ncbi:MAG: secondary thiamine-phosphate synthase enzyme YjbQ [Thermoproteota archaeon]|nr:secondary thiamine-phosphate synthase enzyme YjbQ [Thermoproteota archaeon]
MLVITKRIRVKSSGENDIVNITEDISRAIMESRIRNGVVTVFAVGSTAAITTIEYEMGLLEDFPRILSKMAPKDIEYKHNIAWNDGNGHSHIRSSLIGPSLTVPIVDCNLSLGIWQQIVFMEMDTRPRHREIVLQIMGQ